MLTMASDAGLQGQEHSIRSAIHPVAWFTTQAWDHALNKIALDRLIALGQETRRHKRIFRGTFSLDERDARFFYYLPALVDATDMEQGKCDDVIVKYVTT